MATVLRVTFRRRRIFHQLAALPTDETSIDRVRTKRTPKRDRKSRHEKLAQIEKEHRESEEGAGKEDGNVPPSPILPTSNGDPNAAELALALKSKSEDGSRSQSLAATPGTPVSCPITDSDEHEVENEPEQVQIQHLNNIPEVGKMTEQVVDGNTKTQGKQPLFFRNFNF